MAKSFNDLATRAKSNWDKDTHSVYEAASNVFQQEVDAQAEFGRAIAAARKERHMTQPALAEAAGVQQADISRIENGHGNPTLETLARLTTVLGQRLTLTPQG